MKHSWHLLWTLTIVASQYGAQLWAELDQLERDLPQLVDGSYQETIKAKDRRPSAPLDPTELWVFDQAEQKLSSLKKSPATSIPKEK